MRQGLWSVIGLAMLAALAGADETYEIGGPLAGVVLPRFQGQHGEAPGHPGCVPELIEAGAEERDMGNRYRTWGPQGLAPERELYPGAEEHWRAYMFKYMPIRSFFDRQSQLANWTAPAIPGAKAADVEQYAAPVYWVPRHRPIQDTGKKRQPVAVVRWRVGRPAFDLDLGERGPGMYAVRVIAAVPTEELRTFRHPVFLRMQVNDGLGGETTEYKRRISYCDEFYSVCEFYVHAPERRRYRAKLWVDKGSQRDLLVRNISLDDVLAGVTRAAVKKTVTGNPPKPKASARIFPPEDRLARDAAIWNYLPPLNHQGSGNSFRQASYQAIFHPNVTLGANGKGRTAVNEELGAWTPPRFFDRRRGLVLEPADHDLFLAHPKLGLRYTLEDMRLYRPLPKPYPLPDDGTGLYFPDPDNPAKGQVWAEIGIEVMHRIRNYPTIMQAGAGKWRENGDSEAARDGAVALARYAYLFPSIESATYLCHASRDPGAYGRYLYNRRRETAAMWLRHYSTYLETNQWYDRLFDYIQGNEELAASIGRFIPWVKQSSDVIKLIDMYLVQTTAKRVLRYHYHTGPMAAMELAAILGLNEVTQPWIDWTFARSFVYPLPPAGIADLMISGCDRSGTEYIGSVYYAQGEGARRVAVSVQKFLDMGLLPAAYDLTDTGLYPKPLAQCYWQLNTIVGGRDFLRIGDVAGPDKMPGSTLGNLMAKSGKKVKSNTAIEGWRWSKDPRFAWLLKHAMGRQKVNLSDQAWAAVEAAAGTVARAPWLDLKSRQVYNWAGVLETGSQHDDYRFRRAVYLRTGAGVGHQHNDALDLQIVAHGVPMTIDDGQRPGYSTPAARNSLVHNGPRAGYVQSWVQALADAPEARYLRARTGASTLCQRQVALIDVDEGKGSQPVAVAQQISGAGMPAGVVTANSYVFDVCRVGGKAGATYGFHGPISDEVKTNARELLAVTPPPAGEEAGPDAAVLAGFGRAPESWRAGVAPPRLQVTWRYSREKTRVSERKMAAPYYREDAPRKYTRLHLPGLEGWRYYQADAVCHKWKYRYTHSMTRNPAAGAQPAIAAIIEPYVGKPFVRTVDKLEIADNEDDARQAVALAVVTENGHRDILFADGRPEKQRAVGGLTVSGEFACYSTDQDGLRLATLAGGTLLAAPKVRLEVAQSQLTGNVTAVDYLKKRITIDARWPGSVAGDLFEIGGDDRTTSYTSRLVEPTADACVLTVTQGADYLRSSLTDVDAPGGIVTGRAKPSLGAMPGLVRNFTASNDQRTKFWRADYIDNKQWRLTGAAVSEADFAPSQALRIWEYGVGDGVRMSTRASLRRVEPGVFEVAANVEVAVSLEAALIEVSSDRRQWRAIESQRQGKWLRIAVAGGPQPTYLRVGKR